MATQTDRLGGAKGSLGLKAPCRVATTANITLSGLQTIAGVALAVDNRVLAKNQDNTVENGIWLAKLTSWVRAKDFDGNDDIVKGTRVYVHSGSNGPAEYELTTADPVIIGTSSIAFQVAESYLASAASQAAQAAAEAAQAAAEAAQAAADASAASAALVTGALPRVGRTAMKALDTGSITVAYLTEAGREGMFVWRSGNYATQISTDTSEGVFIKANAIASSAGSWVRVYDGALLIEWFGASTSASAATNRTSLVAALALAAVLNENVTCGIVGTYSVDGSFDVAADVALIGRQHGERPQLSWGSGTAPTNTGTRHAINLVGERSSLVGWEINLSTAGDFRRIVDSGGGNEQIIDKNKITLALTGVSDTGGIADCYAIRSTDNSITCYLCHITHNEITGSCNVILDGINCSKFQDGEVAHNYIHDIVSPGSNRFNWAIYLADECYGTSVNDNIITNVELGGIHLNNQTSGAAADSGRVCSFNKIIGCEFIGISLNTLTACQAIGNYVKTCDLAIVLNDAINCMVMGGYVSDVVISSDPASANTPLINVSSASVGCTIDGVHVDDGGAALHGIYSEGVSVIIRGINGSSGSPVELIYSNGDDSIIANCTLPAPTDTTTGDRIRADGDNSIVSANRVGLSGSQIGIRTAGNDCLVNGNRITGGNYGVWVSAGSNTELSSNDSTGFATAAVLDNGTDTFNRDATIVIEKQTSSANLAAAANAINTNGKRTGSLVWVTTNATIYRARGSTATSIWDPVDGGSPVTPS
jgi:hypothetical protein